MSLGIQVTGNLFVYIIFNESLSCGLLSTAGSCEWSCMPDCKSIAVSEDYADFIVNFVGSEPEVLEQFGAVSEETAREMAEGIAKTSGADIGIATTGIAGPGGGSEEKPVGLVYMGLYYKGRTFVKKCNFAGKRQAIRERAAYTALDWLRKAMLNEE